MRNKLVIGLSAFALTLFTAAATFAADGKTVTVSGEGKCGKCALKETKECQNVIRPRKTARR